VELQREERICVTEGEMKLCYRGRNRVELPREEYCRVVVHRHRGRNGFMQPREE
jgi:hypothetical protein